LGLFGCAFCRIALSVVTLPICLPALPLSNALCVLTPPFRLLALALALAFILAVAVVGCGSPILANEVADFPQFVQHTHRRSSVECRMRIREGRRVSRTRAAKRATEITFVSTCRSSKAVQTEPSSSRDASTCTPTLAPADRVVVLADERSSAGEPPTTLRIGRGVVEFVVAIEVGLIRLEEFAALRLDVGGRP
jgi:hypothetical protein